MTEPVTPQSMSDAEMEYYYRGLYRALGRYRILTLMGWAFVVAGLASIVLGWRYGTPHGLMDILLSSLTIAAGVALVFQSVASLDAYIRIPVLALQGKSSEAEATPAVREILGIVREIDSGGWQEAYLALRELRALGTLHGLPHLPA
jgi:hypothetical protein